MSSRLILAVDPGKASGICLFSWTKGEDPVMLMSGEYQQTEYAAPIRESLVKAQELGVTLEVVCERFTINAQTVRNSQAPFSLEQIGILRQCLMDAGRDPDDIFFQSPADAKAMFTNDKIKKLDYWHRGGEGHALDSIRHALLRLAKSGWIPVRLFE
jgi:hypothetical protein